MNGMKIFGKPLARRPLDFNDGRIRVTGAIDKIPDGYKITGTIKGRAGSVEIFRCPAPKEFLLNNWQSWGPMQKMAPGQKQEGLEERMAKQSRYVFTPIPDTILSHLVSDYFLAWEGAMAGFLTSKVAHPFFIIDNDQLVGCLEYFDTLFSEPVPLDPLVILQGNSVETLLESYADLAAAENRASVPGWNPVGWSSWYHYFTNLGWKDVEKNLKIARAGFPFEVFQIDDGFEKDIGDWTQVKEGFSALPDLARLIRDNGFTAGLWTAPFSASETSDLFDRHKYWMVSEGGQPKECYAGWKKKIYALDTSHPEVKTWLYETFSSLKKMGFDYFKIDFIFSAAMEGARVRNATPIQAYREGLEVVRQAVRGGFLLGCGAPLLPSIGLVNGMRIGEDTARFWNSQLAPFQGVNALYALKNSIMRYFMHKRWWLNDPDCLLLRSKDIELTPNEKELYALVAGALDNMIIESDDLELVDDWGKQLLQKAIGLRGGHVHVKGLLGDGPYLIDSAGGPAGAIRLAANLSDNPKALDGREIPGRTGVFL
jgi:alpha-galactosidase